MTFKLFNEDEVIWTEVPLAYGWKISSHGDLVNPSGEYVRYAGDGDISNVHIDEHYASYHCSVEMIVILAFFDGFDKDFVVSHIDGDPHNHAAHNLMFFDSKTKERIYGREQGRKLFLDRRLKGRVLIVEQGLVFDSASLAANHVGGNRKDVHLCLVGSRKTHRGYSFRYVD